MAKKIIGFGAALVDLLLEESDAFVASLGVEKGGMNLVDGEAISSHLQKSAKEYSVVPGGSACNTMVGLGRLESPCAFVGKTGQDDFADIFTTRIKESGVEVLVQKSTTLNTGRVLSVITPDAQRTMFTDLGASVEMGPESLAEAAVGNDLWDGVDLVYLEGYLAFNEPYFRAIIDAAHSRGIEVALDLASFDVVQFCRPLLDEMLAKVDIIIANEDEAKAFTDKEEKEALADLMKLAKVAIVKVGKHGAYIGYEGEIIHRPAGDAVARDTTGAGDLWAAGFLYGYARDWDMARSADLGSAVANEVVQIIGTTIADSVWLELQKLR
jgi:sugar/nucleoside kinase (ribokinase family)